MTSLLYQAGSDLGLDSLSLVEGLAADCCKRVRHEADRLDAL